MAQIVLQEGRRYSFLVDKKDVITARYVNTDIMRQRFRFRLADGETREFPFNSVSRMVEKD